MKRADIHRAWAPADGPWTPWVKPVLFAALGEDDARAGDSGSEPVPPAPAWFSTEVLAPLEERAVDVAGPYRAARSLHDTAMVIDLPAGDGAELGVALVQHGFRPIPLYNALPSPLAIVEVRPMMDVLVRGAPFLAEVQSSASPAFLLDADRMGLGRSVRPGLFDNRSICRRSDFPSAERFAQAGIRRILLLCDVIREDLEVVALGWQAGGLELWWKRPSARDRASPIALRQPWVGRRIWNQLFRLARRPGADGAYGVLIEEPSSA